MSLGGQGPAHAIAHEAQLNHASDEVTFRGHARLWQEANSIAGPVIVIDRRAKTLVARSADRGEPVRVVLLSAGAGTGRLRARCGIGGPRAFGDPGAGRRA